MCCISSKNVLVQRKIPLLEILPTLLQMHEKPPEGPILNIPSHRQNLVHLRFEAIFQLGWRGVNTVDRKRHAKSEWEERGYITAELTKETSTALWCWCSRFLGCLWKENYSGEAIVSGKRCFIQLLNNKQSWNLSIPSPECKDKSLNVKCPFKNVKPHKIFCAETRKSV